MYDFNSKIEPVFEDCLITFPYTKPVVLKAKMVKNAPAFFFTIQEIEYYLFVDASSYVWKHTLPIFLTDDSKLELIDAVEEYIFRTKQGRLPMTIFNGCRNVN